MISFPLFMFRFCAQGKVQILSDSEVLIRPGEMLLVLESPGTGCSTFPKAMAVETEWFEISSETETR
jgi:energy-coupling factor transporter ATP-binding protein EcfA2